MWVSDMKENIMKEIRIEKVTLNMSAGDNAQILEKSQRIMQTISGKKPVVTKTKKRTTFGMPKGKNIGCKITLRGKEALEVLKNLLQSVDNIIRPSQFDRDGNFSFGIKEYINIPGIKYDPDVGILGLDVVVTLERRGYRVKKRAYRTGRVGKSHKIKPEEAMEFASKVLGANVTEEKEED